MSILFFNILNIFLIVDKIIFSSNKKRGAGLNPTPLFYEFSNLFHIFF
nr:MAG TPA: hypothetical protein [Caudoviricetes sp.]